MQVENHEGRQVICHGSLTYSPWVLLDMRFGFKQDTVRLFELFPADMRSEGDVGLIRSDSGSDLMEDFGLVLDGHRI